MKQHDEDQAYEQWRQAKIDRDWSTVPQIITCRQKVGTVIPFSRTVDKEPNPRIPLSNPVSYPTPNKWVSLVCAALAALILYWVMK